MNRADPDAGTTFSWVTRTLGPYVGWIGGWAVCTTGILVVGSLADVGARYTYLLFGWDGAAGSKVAVTLLAVAYIVVLTAICILGTELSARVQNVMIIAQVASLLLFAGVALAKVWGGDATAASIDPSWSWFSPFAIDSRDALVAVAPARRLHLLGLGERRQPLRGDHEQPARAGHLGAREHRRPARHLRLGRGRPSSRSPGSSGSASSTTTTPILGALAVDVLGSPWDKLVVLAIVTSAIASTQTTIIPASRTTLSMARSGAYPAVLARIHPRYRTPHVATAVVAAARDRLVRAGELHLRELPLRLALGARADDRLLLRAERDRVPRLLPPRAAQVGLERARDRGRPDRSARSCSAGCSSRRRARCPTRTRPTAASRCSGSRVPLAIGYGFLLLGAVLLVVWRLTRPRALLLAPAVRGGRPGRRRRTRPRRGDRRAVTTESSGSASGVAATSADVTLESVTKRFDDVVAVDDLTLEIPRGVVLRAARPVRLRQDDDAADDRRLRGADRGPDRPRRAATSPGCRRTGATSTPSSRATRSSRTCSVFENVAFGLRRRGVKNAAAARAASTRSSASSALEGLGERKPRQLSGGQQQRVALARALVERPARAAARRAARRARPEAPQADAARAEAHPARAWASPSCTSRTTRRRR